MKLEKSVVKHLTPKAIISIKLNSHRVSTQKMYFSRKKKYTKVGGEQRTSKERRKTGVSNKKR